MKKLTISCVLLFIAISAFSQPMNRNAVTIPLTGMNKLRAENPYVVLQHRDVSGIWVNSSKYYWESSHIPGYKKLNANYDWENDAWEESYAIHDSVILNNEGLLGTLIQKMIYSYSSDKYKYRYSYTYNPDKTLRSIKTELATSFAGNNYNPSSTISFFYEEGRRVKDSTYYNVQKSGPQNHYQYNSAHEIVAMYTIEPVNKDTTNRVYYSYDNGMLKTRLSESFDYDTDEWTLLGADSFQYTDGKISNHILYAYVSMGGVASVRPFTNDTFIYNTDGSLKTTFSSQWISNLWQPVSKTEFSYKDNGKPLYGQTFMRTQSGYDDSPWSQYLFDFLASTADIAKESLSATVYPNPASNVLHVSTTPLKNGVYKIHDISGRVLAEQAVNGTIEPISLENLCNGTYYLTVQSQSEVSTVRFVIAK